MIAGRRARIELARVADKLEPELEARRTADRSIMRAGPVGKWKTDVSNLNGLGETNELCRRESIDGVEVGI